MTPCSPWRGYRGADCQFKQTGAHLHPGALYSPGVFRHRRSGLGTARRGHPVNAPGHCFVFENVKENAEYKLKSQTVTAKAPDCVFPRSTRNRGLLRCHLFFPIQFIVEYVLLQDALITAVALFGEPPSVMLRHGFIDMRVHRESLQVMKRKQTDTIRHLFSHAVEL